jgi:hypothetical protein
MHRCVLPALLACAVALPAADGAGNEVGVRRALALAVQQAASEATPADRVALAAELARAVGGPVRFGAAVADDAAGNGLRIASVVPGTTAALAGLAIGDRLTAIDGKPIAKPADVVAWLDRIRVGDRVTFTVVRGTEQTVLRGIMVGDPRVGMSFSAATTAATPAPAQPAPPVAAQDPPAPAAGGLMMAASGGEEDEADPNLASGATLHKWTDIQRRSVVNNLLPAATTVRAGDIYMRVSHIAREAARDDYRTNLAGLDDNVKIGILVGYGLTTGWDVTLQRVNGSTLQVDPGGSKPVNFDYYELTTKVKVVDQNDGWLDAGGLLDLSVMAGITDMQRDRGKSEYSVNVGAVAERTILWDRVRVGVGIFRAGLSAYESTAKLGPETKLSPDEQRALENAGTPGNSDERSTTALPVTVKIALDETFQVFGEAIWPLNGWNTHQGPTLVSGLRINTNTHEYSFYLSNSANVTSNAVITGGNRKHDLNLFGFNINIFF